MINETAKGLSFDDLIYAVGIKDLLDALWSAVPSISYADGLVLESCPEKLDGLCAHEWELLVVVVVRVVDPKVVVSVLRKTGN